MKISLEDFIENSVSNSFFNKEDAKTFYNFIATDNIQPAMLLLIDELKKYGWYTLNTLAGVSLPLNASNLKYNETVLNSRLDDFLVPFSGSMDLGIRDFSGTYYISDIIERDSELKVRNISSIFTHMLLALGSNKRRFFKSVESQLRSYIKVPDDKDVAGLVVLEFLKLVSMQKQSVHGTLSESMLANNSILELQTIFNSIMNAIDTHSLLFSRLTLMQIRYPNDYQLFVNQVKNSPKLSRLGTLIDIND